MIIGYARVSTSDQNLDGQHIYLQGQGCEQIYQEKISSTAKTRPELQKALKVLKRGDTLCVFKLDRLGRSVKDLIAIVDIIKKKEAHLRTSDGIDTSTPLGTFIFHLFASLAEMELSMIRERTLQGLAAARAKGRIGGRPKGIGEKGEQKARAVKVAYEQGKSVDDICQEIGVSKTSLYTYLKLTGASRRNHRQELIPCK